MKNCQLAWNPFFAVFPLANLAWLSKKSRAGGFTRITLIYHETEVVMEPFKTSLILSVILMMSLSLSPSTTFALDPNTGTQDRYSSPSMGQVLSPSGGEPVTKKTTDDRTKIQPAFF